ncbi:Bug family tripartite tricarboxylate transporter substrate binding protein [Paeniroseomonas aquatica]|uniref:Tripartite tricarboxylate transporter substrate binding protein n=1 Tax=Paeniroseomonas aquatica TaxID=373043 RepID=A0ABT8ACZ2_9PROT|nr:tripartite tricarboxylate transporter substrate binding protein [Paeniroseomonas aquatica]MDN3567639.1 tripartite tricarboxylate transporter substrate binding protein [Paeniroseomonas aquatica]
MVRIARRSLLAATLATPGLAAAEAPWPSRGITWVVPFAAGGITDSSSRVVAQRLSQILGQPVVVENRPGAGGTIGAEAVARAAPDGHTLLYGSQGPIAAAPALYPALRYDPKRDFVPVQGLGASPNMVVTSPGRPWRSMAELVAAARARPETLTYASTGVGTAPHLAVEMLQQVTGIRLIHAPYANGAQAVNDVIGGRVDVMWDYPMTSIPHVRDGRLRALAVTDPARVRLAPEVPTMAEAGIPEAEFLPWAGLFLPAATPGAIVARLAAGLREAMQDPRVQEFFDGTATVLWPEMGPERFKDFLAAEWPRIAALVARSGARPG